MFTRRLAGSSGVGAAIAALFSGGTSTKRFEVERSEAEWRRILSHEQFNIMRRHATERPCSSPLDNSYEPGIYHCAACDNAAFSSTAKFVSGTGWPSFSQAVDEAIGTSTDFHLLMPRTEVHCSRCGSHFGHVFSDGPQPTGQRYCINGIALKFIPA